MKGVKISEYGQVFTELDDLGNKDRQRLTLINYSQNNILDNNNNINNKEEENNKMNNNIDDYNNNNNIKGKINPENNINNIENNNNVIIHINESRDNSDNKENISKRSKKTTSQPKISLKKNYYNNILKEENKINNNISYDSEDSKMKLKRNSFFFNNKNNVILINIDNNSAYDETKIKKMNLKKESYLEKYYTNMIKINIDDTNYNIFNRKNEESKDIENDKISLTEQNTKRLSKLKENNINPLNQQNGTLSPRDEELINDKEKEKHKIYYKIFKNQKNIPINLAEKEKSSMDGDIDEIISNQFKKIHDKNDEINKKRINDVYNDAQIRKSQNLNSNIYINFERPNSDINIFSNSKAKMKKSKSSEELFNNNINLINNNDDKK